ncbi:RICIN domain-containing protein [Streptomyces sp. NPDC050585]|uniref:RICIN domain-containing protein n=1 Tax=Streptomyces sp. NPDC050585 TaxID=3365632 RepID=UPI0037AAA834
MGELPGGLLRNVHSGRCLDALGWRTADGSRLGIWDCTPHHTNQQWTGPGLRLTAARLHPAPSRRVRGGVRACGGVRGRPGPGWSRCGCGCRS